jgi:hypothetical protein
MNQVRQTRVTTAGARWCQCGAMVPVRPVVRSAPGIIHEDTASRAWRSVNLLIYHDHEDFYVLFHIKAFAIMKLSLPSSH